MFLFTKQIFLNMNKAILSKPCIIIIMGLAGICIGCGQSTGKKDEKTADFNPKFKMIPSEKFYFNNFVDCNMAEAWISDTFRIFPGKYGEDTLWGNSRELKFASGKNPDEAF